MPLSSSSPSPSSTTTPIPIPTPTPTPKATTIMEQNTPSYYQKIQRLDGDNFVACDKSTKTYYYAIKLLQLDTLDDIDFKLITHDIQICNQLRHPNILQYLYNFIYQDQIWIVSPLCSFTSADRVSRPYGLPELAIAFIIKDTLNALDYLHRRGLIHRSIRGSHILINSSGRCLLSGLKYSMNCISEGKWQSYVHQYPLKARPNINWFSPEILEQNLFGYNHKSDIYSLGITCCELANGVVPFSDLEPTEMLLDKLTGNAPRLLDQTCQELVKLRPNEMSPEDRDKYFVFRGRQFSTAFHTFTSGLCLNFDPQKRPDASKLLHHSFIKQLRKAPAINLLEFLDTSHQIVQTTATTTTLLSDSEHLHHNHPHQQQQQQYQYQKGSTTSSAPSQLSHGSNTIVTSASALLLDNGKNQSSSQSSEVAAAVTDAKNPKIGVSSDGSASGTSS